MCLKVTLLLYCRSQYSVKKSNFSFSASFQELLPQAIRVEVSVTKKKNLTNLSLNKLKCLQVLVQFFIVLIICSYPIGAWLLQVFLNK